MEFQQLMQTDLRKLYATENNLIKGLAFMADKAHDPKLKQAFLTHGKESQNQATRLEQIASMAGFDIKGEKCLISEALVQEAQALFGKVQPSAVVDAGLIGAAQKAEHLEIACYGTARTFAQEAGMNDAVALLDQSLAEEKKTDELLTSIAESRVNDKALSQGMSGASLI